MNYSLLLLPFFVISMIGDTYFRMKNNDNWVRLFQPLTTFIVLLMTLLGLLNSGTDFKFTIPIAIGLTISMIADKVLVNRQDSSLFVKGMALFFVAIVVYGLTVTFLNKKPEHVLIVSIIAFIVFLLVAVFFLRHVQGKQSKVLIIGVLVYAFNFMFFISRAILCFYGSGFSTTQALLLTVGSIVFFLGDSQLCIYHFIDKNFPMAQAPPFYFMGQLLIGLSTTI